MNSVTQTTELSTARDGHIEAKPAAAPLGEAARTKYHDEMLQTLEQHSPEGRDVHGIPRAVRLCLFALATCAVVAAVVVLGVLAGPPAALLGVAIVIAMAGIAALPQWNAARLRGIERAGFENRIDTSVKRLERKHPGQR